MKNLVYLCVLGLLIGMCGGCKRDNSSGSRSFSHNFDIEKEGDLTTAAKMYDSLGRELESRNFKEMKMTENSEMKNSLYEGEYDGFPLSVEIRCLLIISEENPELYYRVSFEGTNAVNEIDKSSKDLRALMKKWCEI
jgi:hypothetical protein